MTERSPEQERLCREIGRQEARKLKSRSEGREPLIGLRMFGMVGWSVAVPTLLGLAAGLYLDRRTTAGTISWTLSLLIAGVIAGCFNAWYWVSREGGLTGGPGTPRGRAADPAERSSRDEAQSACTTPRDAGPKREGRGP